MSNGSPPIVRKLPTWLVIGYCILVAAMECLAVYGYVRWGNLSRFASDMVIGFTCLWMVVALRARWADAGRCNLYQGPLIGAVALDTVILSRGSNQGILLALGIILVFAGVRTLVHLRNQRGRPQH